MIGKIERVPLRTVWQHEARDFTQWLQNNLEALNEVLDVNLSNAERERGAGAFSVDLVAEDESGSPVVIENQLEKSNHDHLGKVITYTVAVDAKTAVWIVADPRPEHVSAITWLNESMPASFYMLKIEAVRIQESPPAPLFTLIVGPSEEGRDVGQTKKEIAERHLLRERFWTGLLHYARSKTDLHSSISPSQQSWISTGAGKSGLSYNYVVRQNETRVELYIDLGRDRAEANKVVFEHLLAQKDEIESAFGEPLDWMRLEGRRASKIQKLISDGGYRNEEKWEAIYIQLVDAMMRLENAVRPVISALDA